MSSQQREVTRGRNKKGKPEMTQRLLHAMSRQRKYQLRHIRAGLCYDCSRPAADGTLFCELHRRKRNLQSELHRRKRNLENKRRAAQKTLVLVRLDHIA